MRVLLDENLPADLAADLTGVEAATVGGAGWHGVTNGELLRRIAGRFDALLTMDRNLQHQQMIGGWLGRSGPCGRRRRRPSRETPGRSRRQNR